MVREYPFNGTIFDLPANNPPSEGPPALWKLLDVVASAWAFGSVSDQSVAEFSHRYDLVSIPEYVSVFSFNLPPDWPTMLEWMALTTPVSLLPW